MLHTLREMCIHCVHYNYAPYMQVVNSHLLGIDWDAPMGSDEVADVVEVPATCNPLTPSDFAQSQLLVDPL